MGMFDDITCEHPLPAQPKPKTNRFSTKDFDGLLDHYTITQDGRLLKNGHPMQFHGSLNFQTYTQDHMWFEYAARFITGRLVEIQPISIYQREILGTQRVFYPRAEQKART